MVICISFFQCWVLKHIYWARFLNCITWIGLIQIHQPAVPGRLRMPVCPHINHLTSDLFLCFQTFVWSILLLCWKELMTYSLPIWPLFDYWWLVELPDLWSSRNDLNCIFIAVIATGLWALVPPLSGGINHYAVQSQTLFSSLRRWLRMAGPILPWFPV